MSNVVYVTQEERMRQLCAQLFRAENPAVIQTVAAELRKEVDEYVAAATRSSTPALDLRPLVPESA